MEHQFEKWKAGDHESGPPTSAVNDINRDFDESSHPRLAISDDANTRSSDGQSRAATTAHKRATTSSPFTAVETSNASPGPGPPTSAVNDINCDFDESSHPRLAISDDVNTGSSDGQSRAATATHERTTTSSSFTAVETSNASPGPGPSTLKKRKQLARNLFEDDTPLMSEEELEEAPVVKKKRGRVASKSAPTKASRGRHAKV